MTKREAMHEINGTIDMIREAARNVDSESDALYVASTVEQWADQLRRDIDEYENADDED